MSAKTNTRCWWCENFDPTPMIVVRGPWAFQNGSTEREFCSMKCFWEWADAMAQEHAEGHGLDGQPAVFEKK